MDASRHSFFSVRFSAFEIRSRSQALRRIDKSPTQPRIHSDGSKRAELKKQTCLSERETLEKESRKGLIGKPICFAALPLCIADASQKVQSGGDLARSRELASFRQLRLLDDAADRCALHKRSKQHDDVGRGDEKVLVLVDQSPEFDDVVARGVAYRKRNAMIADQGAGNREGDGAACMDLRARSWTPMTAANAINSSTG
jgi:hypothetical protein